MKRILSLCLFAACVATAQIYDTNNVTVSTFAGSAFSGYLDGNGQQTMFNGPIAIVADSSNNLFVFDYGNYRIRKITPIGDVSTFVGGGSSPIPGYGTNIYIGSSESLTIDHSNTIYMASYPAGSVFSVTAAGYMSRIAAISVYPSQTRGGLCVDSSNNLYIADEYANKIFRYKPNGEFGVFAGSGNTGAIDGNGVFTSFNQPESLTVDSADNIYVWDSGSKVVRRINQNRDVVTIAGHLNASTSDTDSTGTNAVFYLLSGLASDLSGNLYAPSYTTSSGESVRKIDGSLKVTTLAGSFTQHGYANGVGSQVRFNGEGDGAICWCNGGLFVADYGNNRIRQITFNAQPQTVPPSNLSLSTYPGIKLTGTVGRTYQIQSEVGGSGWTNETTLVLASSPFLWFDTSGVSGSKMYRAVMLP